MNHISDWLTHIDNPEDVKYLRSVLLDVNMRLFHANKFYRAIVRSACALIETMCLSKLEGYKLPHGSSGANLGIPWNIIGIVLNRGKSNASVRIMINPHIVKSTGAHVAMSNCGSIRLKEPIRVERHEKISVSYFNRDGALQYLSFGPEDGGLTIQHEVDHNQGVLITDREIK